MSEKVDITMTAVLRTSVLRQTLETFSENLFWKKPDRFRLIVNIDPVGDKGEKAKHVIKLCQQFFDNVVYNVPKKPLFPRAVIWVWSQVEANWVFHLEDDWLLHKKIDIDEMIDILKKHKSVATLRMLNKRIPRKRKFSQWKTKYIYHKDGMFIAVDRGRQFGLNPVLIKKKFIVDALPKMVETKNPEKQFRVSNKLLREHVLRWEYAIYGKPGASQLVDGKIGYRWRKGSAFKKPRDGKQFLKWAPR